MVILPWDWKAGEEGWSVCVGGVGSAERVVKGAGWGRRILSVDHHLGPGGLW